MTIQTEAPGKLMLAGEWACLELGIPGIVMAIDKKVQVKLEPSEIISVFAPDLKLEKKEAVFDGEKLQWKSALREEEKEKLLMAQYAITTALQYLKAKEKKIQKFSISTSSEESFVQLPDGSTKTLGFGSSGAAVVAIVKAILSLHETEIKSKQGVELVFKLACMAHFEAQGKVGSSVDIAASTVEGIVLYKRFDPKWLQEQFNSGKNIAEIADSDWPSLHLDSLEIPPDFQLLIGYTGPDTSTKVMIKKVHACKEEQKEAYWKTMNEIKQIVEELVPAMQNNEKEKIIAQLQKNRRALQELAHISGIELETSALAKLADIAEQNNAAGKFSGGGGGGVGIGICFDSHTRQVIEAEWKKAGIEPVQANIAKKATQ
ncbi:phosphomevalonate kinase [Candidatus Micrarchaeota archaeon]|nr:phosphomevalonate kinase [Candidatus Micrarchaeota archaeon]MBU1930111.1 phosphomevalonate kinase [Candidatus Micrarchaeota archaeon]